MRADLTGRCRRLGLVAVVATMTLAGSAAVAKEKETKGPKDKEPTVDFALTILHNNDGESQLLPTPISSADARSVGGVARFAALVAELKAEAIETETDCDCERFAAVPALQRLCELIEFLKGLLGEKRGVVMISSGDNFLAGPQFRASLQTGVPFYDSIALSLIGYDAIAIGNHEFDFGPDVLADFIVGIMPDVPFLSANLDVSGEPRLADLADEGIVAKSVVVVERGERIGIVGATTPRLASISSPRNVEVIEDVAGAIQIQVDRLRKRGVNKIILTSHLQSVEEDLALIPMLRGVDVAIAGGGDELLANADDVLIPGDVAQRPYPIDATDAEGTTVPVITTAGSYRYVGRLVVSFDKKGNVLAVGEQSGPVRVVGPAFPDAVTPDPIVAAEVEAPVAAAVAQQAQTIVATTQVPLEGRRPDIRVVETNLGNLVADALLWQAQQLAPGFGVPAPQVALQNGGGIRNNSLIQPGNLSALDTFNILPFPNFLSVVPGVSRDRFKELLENSVARVSFVDGRFAQIAGFSFEWDPARTPQSRDSAGNLLVAGDRVRNVVLDDGTILVQDGVVVPGSDISLATNDFSARGGDQWPLADLPLTTLGVTYLDALENYLRGPLGGVVTSADYPAGGEGRIVRTAP